MKRIALLLLALTTIITTSHAQAEEEKPTKRCEAPIREHWNQGYASSFEQFPLYGNVEYLVANLYMIDEEGNEVHIDSEKFIFNENGDTLTWTAESNTEPNFRMELTYSAGGILIKEEIYRAGELEDTTLYEYSDDLAYRTEKYMIVTTNLTMNMKSATETTLTSKNIALKTRYTNSTR